MYFNKERRLSIMHLNSFVFDSRAVAREFTKSAAEYNSLHATRGNEWLGVSVGKFGERLGVAVFKPCHLNIQVLDEPTNFIAGEGVIAFLVAIGTSEVRVSGIDCDGLPFTEMVTIEKIVLKQVAPETHVRRSQSATQR